VCAVLNKHLRSAIVIGPCFKAVDVLVQGREQFNWRQHPILKKVSYASLVPEDLEEEEVPYVSHQVSPAALQSSGFLHSFSPKGSVSAASASPTAVFQSQLSRQSSSPRSPWVPGGPQTGLAVSPSLAAASSVSPLLNLTHFVVLNMDMSLIVCDLSFKVALFIQSAVWSGSAAGHAGGTRSPTCTKPGCSDLVAFKKNFVFSFLYIFTH
jgi:hypothetical protein